MKTLLRKIRFPWIVSIGSALLGVIILAIFVPARGESSIEGVSFTLGYLSFPLTLLGSLVLWLMPSSWGPDDLIVPFVCAFFYFAQWQLLAWLLHRWLSRREGATTPIA
jgi:hypothetical protein